MKRRQGLAAEVSTLVWRPRAGCALLWTASGCEWLCFSSFAFHLTLRTAECLSHLLLVYVCVVTNRTKNHDRIAYMWKKKAVVGASQCKVSPRSSQCLVQHGLEFGHLLNVWLSGPFLCQTSDPKLYVVFHFGASFFFVLLHVSLRQLDMWRMKCGVWSLSVQCEVRSVKFGVGSKQWEVWSVKWEVWSVDCAVWSEKCEVWSVKFGVGRKQWEVRSVKCGLWSVKCEVRSVKLGVWRKQWEVRSVKCGLWSVKCEVRSVKLGVWRKQWKVRSVKCEVLSVKCEVWSVKEAVRSEKCEVWSVDCEVRSVKCGLWIVKCRLWSVKCEVWSVKEAVRSVKCGVWSLKFGLRRVQCAVWGVECRGKDTVGTGHLWTIGHLCLGNFRRRLARVYVNIVVERAQWRGYGRVYKCTVPGGRRGTISLRGAGVGGPGSYLQ